MILWCRNMMVGGHALMIDYWAARTKRVWKMHTLEITSALCRFFFGEACILRMVLWSMKDEWGY